MVHTFRAGRYTADDFVQFASDIMGQKLEFARDRPKGNTVSVSITTARDDGDYPIYLKTPASVLPGTLAHRLACALGCDTDGRGNPKAAEATPCNEPDLREQGQTRAGVINLPRTAALCANGVMAHYTLEVTQRIPVVHEERSLGAHVDTTARRRGTTLSKRMGTTKAVCKRIGRLPIGLVTTQHLLATTAMPGALYGCESTNVNMDVARKLRTNISAAVTGPRYTNSSPEIVLQGSDKITLEPEIRILDMRFAAMRRAVHKNTRRGHTTATCVERLLQHYLSKGEYMVGGASALRQATAAPPLASTNRHRWQLSARPAGPVALLLHSLGIAGLTMDTDMRIWGPFGNISLTTAPLHLYKSVVLEAATNGVIKELSQRRNQLAPDQGIDWALTRPLWNGPAVGQAASSSQRHLLAFAAGGHWRQHRIAAAEPTVCATCVLCGQSKDDDEHMWHCAALQHVRQKHPMVVGCQAALPRQLKQYGIAPHVGADPRKNILGR